MQVNKFVAIVTRLLLPSSVVLALASCSASPTTESTTTTPKSTATTPCLTLPLSAVPKGRQPQEYKEELKRQTGAKCIFWDINR